MSFAGLTLALSFYYCLRYFYCYCYSILSEVGADIVIFCNYFTFVRDYYYGCSWTSSLSSCCDNYMASTSGIVYFSVRLSLTLLVLLFYVIVLSMLLHVNESKTSIIYFTWTSLSIQTSYGSNVIVSYGHCNLPSPSPLQSVNIFTIFALNKVSLTWPLFLL